MADKFYLDEDLWRAPYDPFDDDEQAFDKAETQDPEHKNDPRASIASPVVDTRPASERIAALFDSMAPRRRTLFGMLRCCIEPCPTKTLNEQVEEMQRYDASVYDAASLTALLERAGALTRVTADGMPYPEESDEPQLETDEDSITYYAPAEKQEVYWLTSNEARAFLDADQPSERLDALLEQDAAYAEVYQKLLLATSAAGGASQKELDDAVADMPILKKPRLYAPHFIDKLEKCEAIEWAGAWKISDTGRAALEKLNHKKG